jgi:hypothetical protein
LICAGKIKNALRRFVGGRSLLEQRQESYRTNRRQGSNCFLAFLTLLKLDMITSKKTATRLRVAGLASLFQANTIKTTRCREAALFYSSCRI